MLAKYCSVVAMLLSSVAAEQLPTTLFSARDGLSPTVRRIVADSRGFLWFSASEGLVRFDGNNYRTFGKAQGLPGLPTDILERGDGTYWVATEEQLCLFDPRPDRKRFECQSPGIGRIRALAEEERGLWCGTDKGLWRRAKGGASWEFVQEIHPDAPGSSIAVVRLLKDSRGDVWAATDAGLYRFRRDGRVQRWARPDGSENALFVSVAETPGAIWAGTQKELWRFRVEPGTGDAHLTDRFDRSHGLPSGYVEEVHYWEGQVWAATAQGLARQLPSGRWQEVELDPVLSGVSTVGLVTDSLGNLWLGVDGAGAARISGSGFATFTEREGLGLRQVWAVFEDRAGSLVALTKDEDSYFLNWFDGYRFHSKRPYTPFPMFNWGWSQIAVQSRAGGWWLATGSGLLHYPNGLASIPTLIGLGAGRRTGNTIRVFEDSQGRIWFATSAFRTIGIHMRDPRTGKFETFDQSHGLPDLRPLAQRPAAFAEDRQGQIWIGALDAGLVRFQNGKFQQFRSPEAPSQGARALLVDRKGRLWISARRRGLLRVDDTSAANPVFNAYTRSSGLSSDTIDALAEDLAGRIYAASDGVIDRLDPDTGRVRAFTTADGVLPGILRAAFRDRSGALWFGGDQGLCRIQPRADRTGPPAVLIHGIKVNGEDWRISDLGDAEPPELHLSPSQRRLEVEFGGFRHDLRYQTRLSGVDAGWSALSGTRSVDYLSLAPGSYELLIRATSPEGILSSSPARVRFRIASPIWQRWWFLLLCLTAAVAITYAAHRIRVTQLLAQERLRTRIATDLHDDNGASLSQIAVLSAVALHGSERDVLSRIAGVSRELLDSMSDIVWAVSPRRDRVTDLLHRMREFAADVLIPRNIEFRLSAADSDLPLNPDVKREVLLIFKETIHNSLRHSSCRRVEVELSLTAGWLVIRMQDDGVGIADQGRSTNGGHGLTNMQRRAAGLEGTLEVTSSPGEGVTTVLRVPLARQGANWRERWLSLR